MIFLLEWIWFLCLLILTGYHMVIFKRKPVIQKRPVMDWPGVSIVIANKNNSVPLTRNIASIHDQDYPLFEIIIVDDNSTPSEKAILEKNIASLNDVFLFSSGDHGKKKALHKGIQQARHDYILCTDADCRPKSDQWIRKMVEAGQKGEVVLGYSPYHKMKGGLNRMIRFETLMTAIQYMSWALAGKPYMGVGRNMLYPRSLFMKENPFRVHSDVPYGDDDLLVQVLSSHARFQVCDDPLAHVESDPATTWSQWFRQKHRHLSAGHYYQKSRWLQPGVYGISLILHWFLIIFLILYSYWMKWVPVMLIGLFIRWMTYASWAKKLGERDTVMWFPFLEIQYALYLGLGGVFTTFSKKKTWN